MPAVQLKAASWARYWPEELRLEVDFPGNPKTGRPATTYSYAEFPDTEWQAFKHSDNHARFFAYRIRNKFVATKIK